MYWLRDGLRKTEVQEARQCWCGRKRIHNHVDIVTDGKQASWRGLAACGSVWSCPVCQQRKKADRAEEVNRLVEWYGRPRAFTLGLTISHAMGHDLGDTRRALARAWTATIRGAPWKRFCAAVGWVGTIRALEVTHGPNGWHPHLHLLVLADEGWEDEERKREDGSCVLAARMPGGERADLWLFRRWCTMVRRYVGPSFVPEWGPGLQIGRCADGKYLAKLGLEISGVGKHAKPGHRTPLQIARDWVVRRRPADGRLWMAYCKRMKRAHQLDWSKGLKWVPALCRFFARLAEQDTTAPEAPPDWSHMLSIGGRTWDEIRDLRWDAEHDLVPKQGGDPVPLALLQTAEQHGAQGAAELVEKLILAAEWLAAQRALAAQKKKRRTDALHRRRSTPNDRGPP